MRSPERASGRGVLLPVLLCVLLVLAIAGVAVFILADQQASTLPPTETKSDVAPVADSTTVEMPADPRQSLAADQPEAVSSTGSPAASNQAADAAVDTSAERMNILLLGVDRRANEEGAPSRSDSIIVVSVNRAKGSVAVISLPRDMWIEIPGFGYSRINAANALGDANGYPGGGPALAAKTIEQNFGLKIDRYARIDFEGFKTIVDALGGVTVEVERPVPLLNHGTFTDAQGNTSNYIPAGTQHLDGTAALQYARSRIAEDDIAREGRQQRLLMAILDRAGSWEVVPRIPALLGALRGVVETDVSPQEAVSLANSARQLDRDKIHRLVVGKDLTTPFVGEGGMQLLRPKVEEIRNAITAVMDM